MGTFNVTSSELNNAFEFKNESLIIGGSYKKDAGENTLKSING